jgi:hypothetical protein
MRKKYFTLNPDGVHILPHTQSQEFSTEKTKQNTTGEETE